MFQTVTQRWKLLSAINFLTIYKHTINYKGSAVSSWDGPTFGHNRHGPKIGGCAHFGEAGSPCNTTWPGPRPTFVPSGILIHPDVWPQQIWAENWGVMPLWGRGARSPLNTIWKGPRPTCTPSFIFIRSTVWPQYTNVSDRTGQRPDSIGEPFYKRSPQNLQFQTIIMGA